MDNVLQNQHSCYGNSHIVQGLLATNPTRYLLPFHFLDEKVVNFPESVQKK